MNETELMLDILERADKIEIYRALDDAKYYIHVYINNMATFNYFYDVTYQGVLEQAYDFLKAQQQKPNKK